MNTFLPVLAPLVLIAAALPAFLSPGLRPRLALIGAQGASVLAFAASVATGVVIATQGPMTVDLAVVKGYGVALRLDAVSGVMAVLVSFIGWVVVRYAATYLDGEARQGAFTGWLCLTLAAALLLVQAGNLVVLVLAWVAAGLGLHRLLVFYPGRPAAQRAWRRTAHRAGAAGRAGRRLPERRNALSRR